MYLLVFRLLVGRGHGKPEGLHAGDFLLTLNLESVTQLGMMADAADEAMVIIRFCDDENADFKQIPGLLETFRERITMLFDKAGCLSHDGYTQFAMNSLRKVKTFTVNGHVHSVGSPSGPCCVVIERCLNRMRAWKILAMEVVTAEFPDFEVLQSFSVLTLSKRLSDPNDETRKRHVARLSQVFEVSEEKLSQQLSDHEPIARRIFLDERCSTGEAWKMAVERTQRRSSLKAAHPVDALHPVLLGDATYGCSTSAVEQGFSKALRLISPQQAAGSPNLEADITKLIIDKEHATIGEVVSRACELWRPHYGSARSMPHVKRLDSRRSKSKAGDMESEQAWLRKRRAPVVEAELPDNPLANPVVWTESHEKESTFQRNKFKKRQLEAIDEDVLLSSEKGEELLAEYADFNSKRAKTDKARQQAASRARMRAEGCKPPTLADFRELAIHVSEPVPRLLLDALARNRLRRVAQRVDARVFVVGDPAEPGNRVKLCAALVGGLIVTSRCFLGGAGSGIKYNAALTTRRSLYISEGIRNSYPVNVNIIFAVMRAFDGCRWTLLDTHAAFLRARGRKGSPSQTLGLMLACEKAVAPHDFYRSVRGSRWWGGG